MGAKISYVFNSEYDYHKSKTTVIDDAKTVNDASNVDISDDDIPNMLKEIDLFKTLSNDEILGLIKFAKKIKYDANKIVIKQGDTGDKFHMIISGKVSIIGN